MMQQFKDTACLSKLIPDPDFHQLQLQIHTETEDRPKLFSKYAPCRFKINQPINWSIDGWLKKLVKCSERPQRGRFVIERYQIYETPSNPLERMISKYK